MKLAELQEALRTLKISAWLFTDFQSREAIGRRILGLRDCTLSTRRWFYLVPADAEPVKVVSFIEPNQLDTLPGRSIQYRGFDSLKAALRQALDGHWQVAMQYSPLGNLPAISTVDAGTIELIRSLGVDVNSSADAIQMFESRLTFEEMRAHERASTQVHAILASATALISENLHRKTLTDAAVTKFILQRFASSGLTSEQLSPIVAINEHAANPHFQASDQTPIPFRPGDRLLIDLWAREDTAEGIYYDIAWCYQLGGKPDAEYAAMFNAAKNARSAAKDFVAQRLGSGQRVRGWEVDDVARSVIAEHGYAKYFPHRTGHSIHHKVHGTGANLDNFESHDDRLLIPRTCFSIEPGLYKGSIGVRTEINVLIDPAGIPSSFGPEQQEIVIL